MQSSFQGLTEDAKGSLVMSAMSPMLMIPALSKLERSSSLRRKDKNEKKTEHSSNEQTTECFRETTPENKTPKENDFKKLSNKTRECNVILLGDLEIGKTGEFSIHFL